MKILALILAGLFIASILVGLFLWLRYDHLRALRGEGRCKKEKDDCCHHDKGRDWRDYL